MLSLPAAFGALWRFLVKIPTMTKILNKSVWILFSVLTPVKWLECLSGEWSFWIRNKMCQNETVPSIVLVWYTRWILRSHNLLFYDSPQHKETCCMISQSLYTNSGKMKFNSNSIRRNNLSIVYGRNRSGFYSSSWYLTSGVINTNFIDVEKTLCFKRKL